MIIAFQGELGAYSEEAVRRVDADADMRPCATFADAFAAVTTGDADRAVLPIENSLFGSVHINYDHLRSHDVRIVGELHLRIRHHLLAVPGAEQSEIRRVRSHPQALGQCRQSLHDLVPGARAESATDTAGAARDVAERGDPSVAAIASRRAADRYGLDVLAAGIEDNPQNYTRFLVLARTGDVPVSAQNASEPADEPERDRSFKTSIVFALRENVPGALFKSLAVFALRDLDLDKIESRPFVGSPGRYRFYLDIRGRSTDPPVQRALDNLREIATELRILGSYPAGPIRESETTV
jgi:prephenate dehydratase